MNTENLTLVSENKMDKLDIINFLKQHKQELYKKFGIRKLALFGSYAKDEQTNESDIDIAIVDIDKKDYIDWYLEFFKYNKI
ncbi:MAG: nucleotidyltransferase domain-containing protein [Campylobacterota bacterium]|nr:nucleotidyltransferase domain-containing protein [Campylobacterota bacterium]